MSTIERVNEQHQVDEIQNHETKRELTPQHLEALATGRRESAIVRRYLDALTEHRPKRGRKPDMEKLKKRLSDIENRIRRGEEDAATRLVLIQERRDLSDRLSTMESGQDLKQFEDEFVKVAASYAARRGIEFESFKDVGVPVDVLKRAGINQERSRAGNVA